MACKTNCKSIGCFKRLAVKASALVLLAFFSISLAIGFAYATSHIKHKHDHQGACSTCARIVFILNTIKNNVSSGAQQSIAPAILFFFVAKLQLALLIRAFDSPVNLKVKLNN